MLHLLLLFFFFNDTATTEIYTLSLHDALPIYTSTSTWVSWYVDCHCGGRSDVLSNVSTVSGRMARRVLSASVEQRMPRSEEHTSELQSRQYLVCRLLLEKKKIIYLTYNIS